jgi:hypothetical protein
MRYLLALFSDDSDWEEAQPAEMKEMLEPWTEYGRQVTEAGVFVAGEGLKPSSTATTLHIGEGEPTVTDGPFAETKEQLGGFYLLECDNLDEALAWARKVPLRSGAIEVRPVDSYSEHGYEHPEQAEVSS